MFQNDMTSYDYDQSLIEDSLKVDVKVEDNKNPGEYLNSAFNKKKQKPSQKSRWTPPKQECSICSKPIFKNNLPRHFRTFHENNCHICYKLFDSKDEVGNHISLDHQENKVKKIPYLSCAICHNWKTAWKSLMYNHITQSHKVRFTRHFFISFIWF